jgi:outer membrane protein OmpA-like peptidoglycan-associated protein
MSLGVPRSRIEVRGYGPDRPLPGTARTSPQNRRVEAVRVS